MDFQIFDQDSFSSSLNESVNSEFTFVQDSVLRYDIPLKKMDHPSLANGLPQNIVDCSGASTDKGLGLYQIRVLDCISYSLCLSYCYTLV